MQRKFFHTMINADNNLKDEIRNILKLFFCNEVLHTHFTGVKKASNKELFKETNFAVVLTGIFLHNIKMIIFLFFFLISLQSFQNVCLKNLKIKILLEEILKGQ